MKIYLHTHKLPLEGRTVMRAGIGVFQKGGDADRKGIIFLPDGIGSEEDLFEASVSLFCIACDTLCLLEGLGFPTEKNACLTGISALRDALKKAFEA